MATLVSPGVDVSIIDESFYSGAGAGTVPLIIMATATNKVSPSGSGYAPYTAPSEAGKLFLATSQRELLQNFGNPKFYSIQGTQLHGHELNEYGLHAAYQYLGISNRAYVMRADIDLAQLEASDSAPRGEPTPGTYWLDLTETTWGVFKSNGNKLAGAAWVSQAVKVPSALDVVQVGGVDVPKPTYGVNGNYAVVTTQTDNRIYEKINGSWFEVGSAAWKAARPTVVTGSSSGTAAAATTLTINGQTFNLTDGGNADYVKNEIAPDTDNVVTGLSTVTATVVNNALVLTETAGGNLVISGTAAQSLGLAVGTTKGVQVYRTNDAKYPTNSVAGDVWVKGTTPNNGANWVIKYYNANTGQWIIKTATFFPYTPAVGVEQLPDQVVANETNIEKLRTVMPAAQADAYIRKLSTTSLIPNPDKDGAAIAAFGIPAAGTVYVGYNNTIGNQTIRIWNGTNWQDAYYEASADEPSTDPEAGTLWYNADLRIDIMFGDGNTWMGYRRKFPNTDAKGVIIAGSAPITQSDGMSPLVEGDLWCDSSDLENYPALYRYDSDTKRWKRIDNTDQTTPFGIIFADARANSGVAFEGMPNEGAYSYGSERIEDMLVSDYLDPDAPDPRFYPEGMLLFNTRYSTYNVKVWTPDYFDEGNFDPNTNYGTHSYTVGDPYYVFPKLLPDTFDPSSEEKSRYIGRWVTASGNQADGSPYMGRKAQRIMVVRAMQAAVVNNDEIRAENVYYNLIAAPGYPELIDEMVTLNTDQKEVSFIVGDTPSRLRPMGSEIENWANNRKLAVSNGDQGLTTANTYVGLYYPWGLSTNVDGAEIMIPPSTIALRTMAYNDQVAYQWFAPAGYQRGLVTNATTVGYLTSEGEFKPVILNPGQRDVLYVNKINPIAYIAGRGLVVYGQKTLHPLESALDRVNVARLTNYLKFNLDNIMKPFLFEQNDQQTRDSAKLTVERFLAGLVTLRALEDYAVLCDETNNTPERRDRNELWVDVLIKPIKAIEFIYVPIRIRNSGDSLTLSGA